MCLNINVEFVLRSGCILLYDCLVFSRFSLLLCVKNPIVESGRSYILNICYHFRITMRPKLSYEFLRLNELGVNTSMDWENILRFCSYYLTLCTW